jgi:membrane-bound lytic murein transglycosylase MltF
MSRPSILLLPALLAGCSGLPRDPGGTTDRIVSTHVLRAGAAENPPWVRIEDGIPKGIEPDIVRAFAATLGARVEWTVNGETPLAEAAEKSRLDLLVSGATRKSPWAKKLGASQAYAAVPKGEKRLLLAATGENQLLLRLDRFLGEHKAVIEARAEAAQ